MNVDPDGGGPQANTFVSVQHCDSPGPIADDGDSGGPVFLGTRAYGIVTHKTGNFFCAHKMLFSSSTHWQEALDVLIVLAP